MSLHKWGKGHHSPCCRCFSSTSQYRNNYTDKYNIGTIILLRTRWRPSTEVAIFLHIEAKGSQTPAFESKAFQGCRTFFRGEEANQCQLQAKNLLGCSSLGSTYPTTLSAFQQTMKTWLFTQAMKEVSPSNVRAQGSMRCCGTLVGISVVVRCVVLFILLLFNFIMSCLIIRRLVYGGCISFQINQLY